MSLLRSLRTLVGLVSAPLLFACSETTVEVELHSLQASGEVSFVCRSTESGRGLDRSLCPDFDRNERRIFALVTQTSTEEVAIIDTQAAEVVDIEPSQPGYTFLRVPARPGAIATSPGGAATFVGIQGPDGKSGITAIPTTCLGPPKSGEAIRDVTTFPSCHLPSPPGDLTVLIAPPEGGIRVSCDPNSALEEETDKPPGAARECPADLTREHEDEDGNPVGALGRRKIAVAIPERSEIAIIDAQWLVDQVPGSFSECRIEATLPLKVDLGSGSIEQDLGDAPELAPPKGCVIQYPETPPQPSSYIASPAGFGPAGNLLYVADRNAPVIHVLDVSNPCAPNELPPLLTKSFENPNREVLTSRVAASPPTLGRRFVYAVDDTDKPKSLMAFDVTPGSTNRTPLVRPNSLRVPEPADRVRLGSSITDVAFALRDLPTTDPETGVAETGVKCDPNPDSDPNSPGALHRPTSDKSRGAQPRLLRGLFGLAMLTSGHVAIIDVDDFDAPCRRPISTNPADTQDFRGCSGDPVPPPPPDFFLTLDKTALGAPTVTNEVSCNVVEPHRLRSTYLAKTNSTDGIGAPALVSFPELTRQSDSVELPVENQPKLLAVPFEPAVEDGVPPDPEVYVGTNLHTKSNTSAQLVTDPNTARVPSLTLPFYEPRAMPPVDTVTLTFEGAITNQFPNGTVVFDPDAEDPRMRLEDSAAQFCSSGVYDQAMLAELGAEAFGIDSAEARELFASTHADTVEVTSDLLPVGDEYWISERLFECGLDYGICSDKFGTYEPTEVNPNRELTILEAYQDRLYVEPQIESVDPETDRAKKEELSRELECCFPQGLQYRVHVRNQWVVAGAATIRNRQLSHDVSVAPEILNGQTHFRCVRDCNPQKKFLNPRVFEVSSSVDCTTALGDARCYVGAARPGDPCVYDACDPADRATNVGPCRRTDASLRLPGSLTPSGELQPPDDGAVSCIYSGISSRFAVYRGITPSERGMAFVWQTTGGFRALITSLAAVSIAVSPQQVDYLPELQSIAIVDGAQLGLSLVSLDSLRVEQPWPVY